MKSLIIGAGQIGQAIYELVKPFHSVQIRDREDTVAPTPDLDILEICYPDSVEFIGLTKDYIRQYKPSLTIIHSTIAVGKTHQCGDHVLHCPIRGRHPNLVKEIPAFPLFVAGRNEDDTIKAQGYFEACNLVVKRLDDPAATELCKVLSNVHMALEVAWRQEVERMLANFGVGSWFYDQWEDTYNLGYRVVGDEQLMRPRLSPNPIGGHCLLECTRALQGQYGSALLDFILESNAKTKKALVADEPGKRALAPRPAAVAG